MKMKNALLVILSVLTFTAGAQEITQANLSWNVAKIQNMTGGDFSEEQATLITYGRTKVELKSYDGTLRWTFDVVEAIGTWGNVNAQGSITYEVKGDSGNGTLTFTKGASETKAQLLVVREAGPTITEYTLTSFKVL